MTHTYERTIGSREARRCPLAGIRWIAGIAMGLLAAIAIGFAPGTAAAGGCITPAIDGSLQDMINFATCPDLQGCGHVVTDDVEDVCVTDALVDPCVALEACNAGGVGYFINGTDITTTVAVYNAATDVTFLGIRTVGQIGDADGDGSDFIGGTCNGTNINDQEGIGSNESYIWSFDLDCDGIFGEAANSEPIVQVANNVVTVSNHASGAKSFDYVGPTGGTDLEVSVAGLGLPAIWRFRVFTGFTFDGKSEDLAISPLCPEPDLSLVVNVSCPEVLCAGASGNITVTVTNQSDVALSNINLNIPLPAGLTFDSIVDGDGWDNSAGGATVTASEPSLARNAALTLVFRVTMESECTTSSKNVPATATGSFSQPGCVELSGTQGQHSCDIRCSELGCDITGRNVICLGEFTEFCGPAGLASYEWTGPGGFTGSDQCTGTITEEGTYHLVVRNADGCAGNCERELTVNPPPPCNITGDDTICGGQKTSEFCGPAGLSEYVWTGPGGFTGSDQCTGPISVGGVYVLTITDANGCENTCDRELFVDQPPSCEITGCAELISGGDPTEFCGPAGLSSYAWTGPGGFTASTRCTGPISELGQYNLVVEDENGCSCENSRTLTESTISCSISGDNEICEGAETQFCGPDGIASYAWTGPGGFTASTQCITVGTEGLYTLDIENQAGCEASCEITLIAEPCGGACPRTPGFWLQQCLCAQGEGGRVKFSCSEMDQITSCIDNTSSFFNWGSDDRANFCVTIPAGHMDQRKQAKRQYAAFLANVCVGNLGIPANNGDIVSLPLDTPVSGACDGLLDGTTVGDLISEVDALLTSLEGQSLDDEDVKSAYGDIITCLDRINNGVGIPFDPEACVPVTGDVAAAFADRGLLGNSQTDVTPTLGGVDLFKPTPNPFKQSSRMAYAVSASTGAQVEISVYNTAGQRVRTLVSGVVSAGRHEAIWDGRDDKGTAVPAGVYFYRSVIGGASTVTRVTYMR